MLRLAAFLITLSTFTYAQDGITRYNKLISVEGTEYVIASFEKFSKKADDSNNYLVFINTNTGESNPVEFSGGRFDQARQIKIDDLGINRIVVSGQTVDLDGRKGIGWDDPTQVFVLSADGTEKKQLTPDHFYVNAWTANHQTGTIVVVGHYDSNNNGKHDPADRNETQIYDLQTLELRSKI